MGVENALKTTPTGNNSKKSFQVGFSFIYFNKKKVITIPLNTRFNFIGIILNKSSSYLSKN
jgi:hypothetical protein